MPVDPDTGRPLPPRAQPGYYPGFSTLGQQAFWDEATRAAVLERVERVPPIRFFSPEELELATAVFDRIVPQDDRDADHRIPVVNYLDERLYSGRMDGYRYEDMPPDGEAYRLGLKGIDAIARQMHGRSFRELGPAEQDEVLWTLHQDRPPEGDIWGKRLPADRFWLMLLSDAAEGYYSHPYAWDEVGFGGPAYPRGYFRLEKGQPEPWEVDERRYAWETPPGARSGTYKPLGGRHPHRAPAGQEGTH
ncbi:MAG: gluconate 2-dehydrogenase subunit 3 family protein [Chloroflexi bacterium]|nr:gluconate 2-dehydrogenase subunit 3 family protein [Chloroflexota bacterium]